MKISSPIIRKYMLLAFCIVVISCQTSQTNSSLSSLYQYYPPKYSEIGLKLNTDTLHFVFNDKALHEIGAVNLFVDNGIEYLSVQDDKTLFLNIYQLNTQEFKKKIFLKNFLPNIKPFLTSVYVKNFDSLFISDRNKTLYLLDSNGKIKYKIPFPEQDNPEMSAFANIRPIILKDSVLFAGICPSYKINYKNGLSEWRLLYSFNSFNNKTEMFYQMPPRYHNNLFDYHFFNYSYCSNDKGNFVFSFPADSNIYETNLLDVHTSYYGKSQLQKGDILPEYKEDLENGGGTKQYRIRDAYGPIFFDPYHKRYLRLFMQKMTEADVTANKHERKQSIIVFNDSLQIIGESPIHNDISFSGLILTQNGNMYVRVKRKDRLALHFIRLKYDEDDLASQETKTSGYQRK